MSFIRCDRGSIPADHHTLAMALGPANRYVHSAYQVCDLDALAAGGEYLRERGYFRSWGIGRHIQGSQLFDYWRDPDGFLVEHFADGECSTTRSSRAGAIHRLGAGAVGPAGIEGFSVSPESASSRSTFNHQRFSRPQRVHPDPPSRPPESSQLMTIPFSARPTHGGSTHPAAQPQSPPPRPPPVSCSPTGDGIQAAAPAPTPCRGHSRAGLARDSSLPRGGADDELRLPRQGRGHRPGDHPLDLLPQDLGFDQRTVRRYRQARPRQVPGLRSRDRPRDRQNAPVGTTIAEAKLADTSRDWS